MNQAEKEIYDQARSLGDHPYRDDHPTITERLLVMLILEIRELTQATRNNRRTVPFYPG